MAQARWGTRTLLFTLTLALLVASCDQPRSAAVVPPRPECPEGGLWSLVFAPHGGSGRFGSIPQGELALSRGITDVVEFHDCQQFIVPDARSNRLRYTSLFAIFARLHLDSAYRQPADIPTPYDSLTMGTPMGIILSYDSTYSALGIEREFNCLYFFRTDPTVPDAWEARVVPVHQQEKSCVVPLQRNDTRPATTLSVSVVPQDANSRDDPPPVARWDWDAVASQQYIGIRCGRRWCEVHPQSSSGAMFSSSVPIAAIAGLSKGWYDEQRLAVAHELPGKPDEVSVITGTFIPVPSLGKEGGRPEQSQFRNKWIPTAHAAIRGDPGFYTSKLNLIESGESVAENEVSMCYVPEQAANECVPSGTVLPGCTQTTGWFGRIVHTSGPSETTKYFCVTRRGHDEAGMLPAPPVPGTVRWRWAIDDETMWVRCLNGCCEVKAR